MADIEAPKIVQKSYFDSLEAILKDQIDKAYFEALGRFMHEFSGVEQMLYMWLCAQLKLTTKEAAAIFAGVRAMDAITNIKRLHEARDKNLPTELADLFEHVGTLNTARNEIIHYGAEGSGLEERRVSTELRSHTTKKAKNWPVSAETLKAMFLDAEKVNVSLIYWIVPGERLKEHPALARAWQYKYPANPQAQSRKGAQKGQKKKQQPKGPR